MVCQVYKYQTFIDCGGKVHIAQTCQLQAWLGTDTDHRLRAGKMAGVLNQAKAKGVLPAGEDIDVEIEYEDKVISQYTVASFAVTEDAVVLNLAAMHIDCLAKDVCLPQLPMVAGAVAGCCGPECCGEKSENRFVCLCPQCRPVPDD